MRTTTMLPLNAARERVANALNVSRRTVNSSSQAVTAGESLRSLKKTKLCQKPAPDVDHFDQVTIRNIIIYDMIKNKQYFTRKTLLQALQDKGIFHGGITSLGKVLHNIGFSSKKDDPRRGLMELPNTALLLMTMTAILAFEDEGEDE